MADVAVVGAGAAGLSAAVAAAEAGARVILFNATPRIGLKILMSGGTRCNLTHDQVGPEAFHGGSRHAVRMVLDAFPAPEAMRWFEGLGVALKVEPGGKVFPASDSAKTVLHALRSRSDALGVVLRAGEKVIGVRPGGPDDAGDFIVETARRDGDDRIPGSDARKCRAGAVILATGGLSFPKTGSDGGGYEIARALGHSLTERTPALTPMVLGGDLHRRLQGITLPAALTLSIQGRRAVTTAGSLLFTHFGISGPAALDMSRHWLRTRGGARTITAHLLPGDLAARADLVDRERPGRLPDADTVERAWLEAARTTPRGTIQSHYVTVLPARVVKEVAELAGLDHAAVLAQVKRDERKAFVRLLTALPLEVCGTLGYEKAEVTAGGVPLDEIDVRRMMSRLVPGLFFAGEILDVDGRLGGYNFQWAWSGGRVAGRSAAQLIGAASRAASRETRGQ